MDLLLGEQAPNMNGSTITEFVLLGFSCSRTVQLFIFALVLACYTTVLLGNVLIMVTVWSEPQLSQCPMYFFLVNLSLTDVSLGSLAAPKLVIDLLNNGHAISYEGCMAQIFGFHLFAATEMYLLTLMAYDRYIAICHPLRYTTIMGQQRCLGLLILCWMAAFIHSTFHMAVITRLPFCGPNVLDNFFCDSLQVIKLACSDIYIVEKLEMLNDSLVILPCFLSLLVSYVTILATLCGRFGKSSRKTFSTCSSHLTVVGLFYIATVLVYLKPSSHSQLEKMASVFFMVVTPALNPLIYTLRNQEMKVAIGKLQNKCKLFLLSQREYICLSEHLKEESDGAQ
ncbi:olfactory receptor 4Q3-like [Hemicordylus capensis]|uniref:olfactory receptor 4Q3-like n=1 Tax=Hemicordylus capensis TaxID=884348 RepID=UPI002303EE03|nr:olfactory receptor 4Q3-like [Hemicordylus capensis]